MLLHSIRKDTEELPEGDIARAQERWEDVQERMNANPRRPPRAMGHDAPSPNQRTFVNHEIPPVLLT